MRRTGGRVTAGGGGEADGAARAELGLGRDITVALFHTRTEFPRHPDGGGKRRDGG